MNFWPWRTKTNDKTNETARQPKIHVVALPLAHEELLALIRLLVGACKSEHVGIEDKQVLVSIRDHIDRYAVRQGAWWDAPWSTTPVVTNVVWSGAAPRE